MYACSGAVLLYTCLLWRHRWLGLQNCCLHPSREPLIQKKITVYCTSPGPPQYTRRVWGWPCERLSRKSKGQTYIESAVAIFFDQTKVSYLCQRWYLLWSEMCTAAEFSRMIEGNGKEPQQKYYCRRREEGKHFRSPERLYWTDNTFPQPYRGP